MTQLLKSTTCSMLNSPTWPSAVVRPCPLKLSPLDCDSKTRQCLLRCAAAARFSFSASLTRTSLVQGDRRATPVRAASGPIYPFQEEGYHRVGLVKKDPYGPMRIIPDQLSRGQYSGVLVFQKEGGPVSSLDAEVLEVFVAGDTAANIYTLLQNQRVERPMAHDLLWSVLNHASDVSRKHWQLLRVAIVALRDDVFIGRLFFGDPDTHQVMWDCDCRPSDGCYLHLKSGCPFFVSKSVWSQAAVALRNAKVKMLADAESQMASRPAASATLVDAGAAEPGLYAAARNVMLHAEDYCRLRPEDPEAIKLLKRELMLAVAEEDYQQAIRIRDHPWLRMHRDVHTHRASGRNVEASMLESELKSLIERNAVPE